MKKRLLAALLITVLVFALGISASAAEFDYTLTNLKITSDSISVDVLKTSDTAETDRVFIAMYDDYNMLLGMLSEPVTLSLNGTTTITKTLAPNRAVTVKAFVWGDMLSARSKTIYKTTRPSGEIEDGGEA